MGYLLYYKKVPLFCWFDHFLDFLPNFFVGVLENLRHQKDILKLTDL